MIIRLLYIKLLIISFLAFPEMKAQSTLDYYIDHALKSSPEILQNKNQVKITENDRQLFKAGIKPQVGFSTDLMWDPILNGYGYDEIITNGQVVGTLVNFDKRVLFREQLESHDRFFTIQAKQAEILEHITEATLTRDITSQYLTVWGDLLQWQYNRELLHSLQGEDSILNALTKANIYRQNDYYTFLSSIKNQELTVSNALLAYRQSLTQLRMMAGINDTTLVWISVPELNIRPLLPRDQSVFFDRFRNDSMNLENRLRLTAIEYQPQLSIHADAGYLSSMMITPYKNFGAGVGLKFSVPIYDGRQKEVRFNTIGLLQDENRQKENFFGMQYDQRSNAYNRMLADLEKQAEEIGRQLDFYRSLIRIDKKLIRSGQLDITQYFLILRNYLDVRNESAKNQVKQLMLINELNFLSN